MPRPRPTIDPSTLTPSVMSRFNAKWTLGPGVDACWVWAACADSSGYGRFRVGGRAGRTWYAHRLSYTYWRGPIGDGLQIDHLCRNTSCVNPAHLDAVTQSANIRRGDGVAAANAVKTHCPQGHEYTAENTEISGGGRQCVICRRERGRSAAGRAYAREYQRSRRAAVREDI